MTLINKSSDTYKSIAKYLEDSLGLEVKAVSYVATHSNEGLTPIVHYDVRYIGGKKEWPYAESKIVRVTVYWNNETDPPTITRMDVAA